MPVLEMTTVVRLDPLHEEAVKAACDLDRAYFDDHPGRDSYIRQPVAHELCAAFPTSLDHSGLLIPVMNFGDGLRGRLSIPAGARA